MQWEQAMTKPVSLRFKKLIANKGGLDDYSKVDSD